MIGWIETLMFGGAFFYIGWLSCSLWKDQKAHAKRMDDLKAATAAVKMATETMQARAKATNNLLIELGKRPGVEDQMRKVMSMGEWERYQQVKQGTDIKV